MMMVMTYLLPVHCAHPILTPPTLLPPFPHPFLTLSLPFPHPSLTLPPPFPHPSPTLPLPFPHHSPSLPIPSPFPYPFPTQELMIFIYHTWKTQLTELDRRIAKFADAGDDHSKQMKLVGGCLYACVILCVCIESVYVWVGGWVCMYLGCVRIVRYVYIHIFSSQHIHS